MKKLTLLILTCFLAVQLYSQIHISNSTELLNISDNTTGSYVLDNDIDMEGVSWTPFDFSGTLDGQGYSILNLEVSETGYAGLFMTITGAAITNIGLEDISISGQSNVGGIAAVATNSSFDSCFVTGVVSSTSIGGGLVGLATNTFIEQCYTEVTLTGADHVGGIAGHMNGGKIINSYTCSDVISTGYQVGGIAGWAQDSTEISKCFAVGTVMCEYGFTGGIIGVSDGDSVISITECLALQTGLTTTNGDIAKTYRIIANEQSAQYSTNYGLSSMTVTDLYKTSWSGNVNGKDGGNITSNDVANTSFYSSSVDWDFSIVWEMNDTTPKLQWLSYDIDPFLPNIEKVDINYVTEISAIANLTISKLGNPKATTYGVCYNTSGNPTLDDVHIEIDNLSDTGTYSIQLSGLTANNTYYVSGYIINSLDTIYGNVLSFTALNAEFSSSKDSVSSNGLVGYDNTDTVYIKNTGEGILEINSISCSSSQVSVSPATADIASNDSLAFIITYNPGDSGTITEEIIFTSNAGLDTIIVEGSGYYQKAVGAGNAMDFDGTDDYISFNKDLSSLTDFTLEQWIYVDNFNSWARTIDFGSGTSNYVFFAPSNGTSGVPVFQIAVDGTNYRQSANSTLTTDCWHHIAVTLSGTTLSIYIDGVLDVQNTSYSVNPSMAGSTTLNYMGRSQYSADKYFDGKIDEVRIWNKALTQEEIRSQYGQLVGNEDGLYAYWRFDEEDGDYVYDATGNGNTGTLMNGTAREIPSTAPVADPVLTAIPDSLLFGSLLSEESDTINLKIKNTGGGILHIDSLSFDAVNFKVSPESNNLFSGDSTEFEVVFVPDTTGDFSGYIVYNHNMGTDSSLIEAYCVSLPHFTITAIDSITCNSALVYLDVDTLGSPAPKQYGICWIKTGSPTLDDTYTNEGALADTGLYNLDITGLKAVTEYFVKAYLVNGTIITYSDELSFTTTKITPVITWAAPSGITYGTALSETQLNAVADVTGSFTYSPVSGTMLDTGDSQELSAVFTPTYPDSVFVDSAKVSINVAKAALTATAGDASRTYGEDNPAFTVSYTGFVNDEDATVLDTEPTATSDATATSGAGSYEIVASGGEDGNYEFTYQAGTLTVNKVALAVGVEDETIEKGTTIPDFTITYSGFVNSEDESVLDTPPSATCEATTESEAGTYDIVVSGGSDNNYEMSYTNGTLTITPLSGLGDASVATISVYPNPVSDKVNINLNETMGTISYKLLSITGKVMKADVVENGSVSIDMSRFETGIYILKLLQDNKELNYRIVKE